MTELRQRMIEDMRLRGLAEGTQQVYVEDVKHLAAHYRRLTLCLTPVRKFGLREALAHLTKETTDADEA